MSIHPSPCLHHLLMKALRSHFLPLALRKEATISSWLWLTVSRSRHPKPAHKWLLPQKPQKPLSITTSSSSYKRHRIPPLAAPYPSFIPRSRKRDILFPLYERLDRLIHSISFHFMTRSPLNNCITYPFRAHTHPQTTSLRRNDFLFRFSSYLWNLSSPFMKISCAATLLTYKCRIRIPGVQFQSFLTDIVNLSVLGERGYRRLAPSTTLVNLHEQFL